MSTFTYSAISKEGKRETGTLEATSTLAAGHLLKEQGLMPLELKEQRHHLAFLESLQSIGTVSLKEKIVFINDLHIMLKAGISAPRALKMIAKQTRSKKFQSITFGLAGSVESGKSINQAMEAYPKVFSHIFVSMVKVGELSGNLEKSLEYLGIQLQREADLRSKVKGAMIYPAVIVSAIIIVGVLMAIFVLPNLTETFKDFDTQLPLITRIVIGVSDFMAAHAIITLFGMVALVVGFILGLRTAPGQRGLDWFLLHVPIINGIVKKINLARCARVLNSMLKSGIAIVEGLNVTANALDNSYYREALLSAANGVKLGKPLTAELAIHEKLFPSLVVQMLEVGEETGTLDDIAGQLAEHFEAEVDDTMRNLSSVIEPLLLLFIGGVVGVLALALISPIYNIGSSIQ